MTHGVSRSTWYVLLVIYVSMFAAVFGGIWYTNSVQSENDRKWCHLLTTLDGSYQQRPPQTDTGRQVATDIHQLLADLRCGNKR